MQVEPKAAGVQTRVLVATVAGNALEVYDFLCYAFFAVYIGKAFFPAATPAASLLLTLAVFGAGFVTRPVGSILFGALADRAGRKPALLATMALMAVGTLGLAITPTYESIGVAASLIVVVCRLLQGAALGGELGPATAYVIECAPPARRGLYGGWMLASQGVAAIVAGVVGVTLGAVLTADQMQAWGWRVPFAIGLVIVPVALYLRRSMPESLNLRPGERGSLAATAGRVRAHRGIILLATLLVLGSTVATYVGAYMATYAIAILHLPPGAAMGATAMVGITTLAFGVLGGWLSDRIGRRPMLAWPRVALAVLIVPAFMALASRPSVGALLAVAALLGMLGSLAAAPGFSAIPELLPREIRATGLALAYAVGVALFGGTTQFVVTWLIEVTGDPTAPAWYVCIASVVGAAAAFALPESRDPQALSGEGPAKAAA